MIRQGGNRRGGRSQARGAWTSGREAGLFLLGKAGPVPLALLVGVLALWLAWSVHQGERAVEVEQLRQEELLQQHQELSRQRDELRSRERIEAEAARLGLQPPKKGQVQRP
ncbi:hypothetical protein [Desulfurivibrio alkaliphilus]|uniref:Septum formation initiator n=1 Tax=Desulfurivibrio alkaliphilus (strain DSM 19089 / UNIQEM U267 / AHT2) TaxID=589865 RepID=D6Z3Q7_DESAT|nr:hypothetical protein [Desulfurivibrio alkaliphilus]ADH86182.1 septum formation initiator [Desulfurivibrio alkaliphilus AHT 2]